MDNVAENIQPRLNIFAWRYQASVPLKITMALGMAVVIGLLAQLRLPLAFTPVPVTGQTFAVLMAGVLLGRKWGAVSLGIYGVLGLIGLPWLTGGVAGFGVTTGYLLGFVLATVFIGYMTSRRKVCSFGSLLAVMLFASLVLVYVPGMLWLGGWFGLVLDKPATLAAVFSSGMLPFIAGDILKAVFAAGVAWIILPKTTSDARTGGVNRS